MANKPRSATHSPGQAANEADYAADQAPAEDAPSPKRESRPKLRGPRPADLTKVSANFVSRAVAAIEVASEITGDNQTDVLNRSVQLYAYLVKLIDEGKLIFIEDPATGGKERLVLL